MTHVYLLVGEAPPPGDPRPPPRRLEVELALKASGQPPSVGFVGLRGNLLRFARATTHVNLLEKHPGSAGKGSAFPFEEACAAARDLVAAVDGSPRFPSSPSYPARWAFGGRLFLRPDLVILCGARVAAAFGLGAASYFRRRPLDGTRAHVVVVPHPSGVNRWWNEAANQEAARRYLTRLGRCA